MLQSRTPCNSKKCINEALCYWFSIGDFQVGQGVMRLLTAMWWPSKARQGQDSTWVSWPSLNHRLGLKSPDQGSARGHFGRAPWLAKRVPPHPGVEANGRANRQILPGRQSHVPMHARTGLSLTCLPVQLGRTCPILVFYIGWGPIQFRTQVDPRPNADPKIRLRSTYMGRVRWPGSILTLPGSLTQLGWIFFFIFN